MNRVFVVNNKAKRKKEIIKMGTRVCSFHSIDGHLRETPCVRGKRRSLKGELRLLMDAIASLSPSFSLSVVFNARRLSSCTSLVYIDPLSFSRSLVCIFKTGTTNTLRKYHGRARRIGLTRCKINSPIYRQCYAACSKAWWPIGSHYGSPLFHAGLTLVCKGGCKRVWGGRGVRRWEGAEVDSLCYSLLA